MGKKADELARVLDADTGAMTSTSQGFEESVRDARGTARILGDLPDQLGMGGVSGTAATDHLSRIATMAAEIGTRLAELQDVASRAERVVIAAQKEYHALPDGELSSGERNALIAAGTVLMPGLGTIGGKAAGDILSDRREAAREKAAAEALRVLESDITSIDVGQQTPRYAPTEIEDDVVPADGDTDGTGSGTPSGYSSPSGSSGSGGRPVRTSDWQSAGLVGSSWEPPSGTPVTGINDGPGGDSGTDGPRVGDSWPGSKGGNGGSGGSGGSGHAGTGDGTSPDGLVGGTVPGGSSGSGTHWGGSGSAGSAGSGLGGLGAGGVAGGLTVGGAALGGAGLSRLAGGAGGFGGAGGLAGFSGAGGVGGLGGVGGAGRIGSAGTSVSLGTSGASGSGLSGSASSLVQGSQTGAAGAGASGARAGGAMGGPMGGGSGSGSSGKSKRRGSAGLLAPDIDVEDAAERPDLGSAARAGGRDSLRATAPTTAVVDEQDEW